MKKKQCLIIILPPHLAELPIQIIRGSGFKELICGIQSSENNLNYSSRTDAKYVFVWHQNDYLKLTPDEILWIEADGSYSKLHLTNNRNMVLSFHLAIIEKELPVSDFMRIHRSYIVNLKHVVSLIGNSLNINGKLLTIGREYREHLLERFIFLGVRRRPQ